MTNKLQRFLACKNGGVGVEYGLIGALVVVAILGSLQLLGGNVSDMHDYVATSASDAMNP